MEVMVTQAGREVVLGPLADAATFLQDSSRRPAERITLAAIRLDEALTGSTHWTEPALAELTGLTRHQVRQAVAALRADGALERQWVTTHSADRPAPSYVWAQP